MSLVVGPRQVGKTTLLFFLIDYLAEKKERTVYLNLDIERDKRFCNSQEELLEKIELEIGRRKGYVFIDEIQRKENAGLFLKGLYDMRLPYKFIVSGSGSLELKEKIHESLAGRKQVFEVGPVSFEEFVNLKTEYKYEDNLSAFLKIEKEKAWGYLKQYFNFGGYPRVVLEDTITEKRKIIDELFSSYLEKDISVLLNVKKVESFSSLIRLLSVQAGQIINMTELGSTLGISLPTVKDYLWYAQKTFIIKKVAPYFRNKRKEITKSPVVYFNDLGLKNYSAGVFGNVEFYPTGQGGFLFQNYVFNLLHNLVRHTGADIHFWRTKDGAEVDFVIIRGEKRIPIEVKFKNMKKPKIQKGLRSFIDKYNPEKALVVNLGLSDKVKINDTNVLFCPHTELVAKTHSIFN